MNFIKKFGVFKKSFSVGMHHNTNRAGRKVVGMKRLAFCSWILGSIFFPNLSYGLTSINLTQCSYNAFPYYGCLPGPNENFIADCGAGFNFEQSGDEGAIYDAPGIHTVQRGDFEDVGSQWSHKCSDFGVISNHVCIMGKIFMNPTYICREDKYGVVWKRGKAWDLAIGSPSCSSVPIDLEQGIDDHGISPQDSDSQNKTSQYLGNPINILNGNKYDSATDLVLPTPNRQQIRFSRSYNSQSTLTGTLGYGWTHNYSANLTIILINGFEHIRIEDYSGRGHYFKQGTDNRLDGVFNEKSYVISETDGSYTWHKTDGTEYRFNGAGFLTWLKDEFGNQQDFTPDANNRIASLIDQASGRSLIFTYNANGLLESITGPFTDAVADGVWVTYGYDGDNNLTSVTYADGSGFDYEYDASHHLTVKKDKMGHVLTSWTYDAQGRAIGSTARAPKKTVTINYDNYETAGTIDVSDSYGVTHTYTITKINGLYPRITNITGPGGCTSCAGEKPVRYAYDALLNVTEEEYANGKATRYTPDERGNPTTITYGSYDENRNFTILQTIDYQYHEVLNTPLSRTEASVLGAGNKVTIWDYDDDGGSGLPNDNPTLLIHRKIESGNTKDQNGPVPYEYVTKYTYNTKKQLISIDGPVDGTADTSTFTYGPVTGDLLTVTRPVVGTVIFGDYDDAGNPGNMTDVNGQQTDFSYDGRNRQLSLTINPTTQLKPICY